MKHTAFGFIFLLAQLISPLAIANELIGITESSDGRVKYLVNPSTISPAKNKQGHEITGAIFERRETGKIEVQDKYVVHNDCDKGYGKLITLNVGGGFKYSTDYVIGGESVASSLAEFLCNAYTTKRNHDQSLSRNAPNTKEGKKWAETIDEFLKTETLKHDGVDYRKDSMKMYMLDTIVKQLANDPKNSDKPMLWFLVEADRIVKENYSPERSWLTK